MALVTTNAFRPLCLNIAFIKHFLGSEQQVVSYVFLSFTSVLSLTPALWAITSDADSPCEYIYKCTVNLFFFLVVCCFDLTIYACSISSDSDSDTDEGLPINVTGEFSNGR